MTREGQKLTPLEESLASVAPRPLDFDRDVFFYRAGELAARRDCDMEQTPLRRWGWPAAFSAMTTAAAILLAMQCHRQGTADIPDGGRAVPESVAESLPVRDPAAQPESRLAEMMEYQRLCDAIFRDGIDAHLPEAVVSSETKTDSTVSLSSAELLNQMLNQ